MKKMIAMLLCLAMLCGCQLGPTAEQTAEALCRLYIAGEADVEQLPNGLNPEKIREELKEGLYQQLKDNLEAIGAGEPDEQRLRAIADEMLTARSRIPVSAEKKDKSSDKLSLSLTVGTLDISALDAKAAQEALESLSGQAEDSDDYRHQLLDAYLDALQDVLAEFDGSGEESVVEVEFVKTEGLWLPENMDRFIEELGKAIRR